MGKRKKRNEWVCGYACAISAMLHIDGPTTQVVEAFRAQFDSVADAEKQGVDEYDLERFREHQYELDYIPGVTPITN